MPAKIRCPQCGRRLPRPAQAGTVACDGCEHRFDPKDVRYVPASLGWRFSGAVLLALGGLTFLTSLSAALTRINLQDPGLGPRLTGMFLVPVILLVVGSILVGGDVVHEETTPSDDKIEQT
jgi:hypothetical protein